MPQPQVDIRRQLTWAVLTFVVVILVGAVGYYVIERFVEHSRADWTPLDAIYMAVITVSTVGFKEVHDTGPIARGFTIVLILFGVGAFTYLATSVANYLIAGELHGYWRRRRMQKSIAHLSDHFIVCAFGRTGSEVAAEFKREKLPVVVIDPNEDALRRAVEEGYYTLLGDAKEDDLLRQAGIERARGLVACIDGDADNLMVVLSARALNERLFIVSRTNLHETSSKLLAAGANRVLWPYGLGGRRMAQMAIRPNVVEFLEVVMHDEELELLLEELTIAIGSALESRTIGSSPIRSKTGTMIVALRRRDGRMQVAPSADTVLGAGDIMVALGTRDQLARLRELAHGA
jgi:voltage-gated potassium channel